MKTLVQIPGTQVWVNPRYVTSVFAGYVSGTRQPEPNSHKCQMGVLVEYEGNQGYRTRETGTLSSMQAVLATLNQEINHEPT